MSLSDHGFLVNDDIKVIHGDMTSLPSWELNRKKAGIDDKIEELEEDQVRFETNWGMDVITLLYENKGNYPTGLLHKESME
jgi:hypothetical protein